MDALDTYISDLRRRLAETDKTDRQLAAASRGRFTTRWLYDFRQPEKTNFQTDTLRALDLALTDGVEAQAA